MKLWTFTIFGGLLVITSVVITSVVMALPAYSETSFDCPASYVCEVYTRPQLTAEMVALKLGLSPLSVTIYQADDVTVILTKTTITSNHRTALDSLLLPYNRQFMREIDRR